MYFAWSHKYSIWFRAAGSFIPAAWLKGLLGLINKRAHPSLQRRYFTFTRDTKITRSQLEPKQVQFYWTGDFKRLELTPGLRKRVHWIRIRCSSATSPPDPGCLGYLTPRSVHPNTLSQLHHKFYPCIPAVPVFSSLSLKLATSTQ